MSQATKQAANNRVGNQRPNRAESQQEVKRIPIAQSRDKMTVRGMDPNRKYRWVKDVKDGQRILMFQEAGYRIETDQTLDIGTIKMADTAGEGSPIRQYVEVGLDGKSVYQYLMSIKREWFDEDQAAKQQAIDEMEKGMKTPADGEHYVPKTGIHIEDDGIGRKF